MALSNLLPTSIKKNGETAKVMKRSQSHVLKSLKKLDMISSNIDEGSGISHDLTFATTIDAALHGISLYHDPHNRLAPLVGPLTAVPSPWPRKSVELACSVSSLMAVMLTMASMDRKWIYSCLKDAGVLDDDRFIQKLADIMIEDENQCPVEIVLFRNDFMMHVLSKNRKNVLHPVYGHVPFKAVEQNTVAVGMSYLSDQVKQIHNNMMNRLKGAGHLGPEDEHVKHRLVDGIGCQTFGKTIAKAVKTCAENGVICSVKNRVSLCLMITEDLEKNCIDQLGVIQAITKAIQEEGGLDRIVPLQRTISYLLQAYRDQRLIIDDNGCLTLIEVDCMQNKTDKEICVVYWRMFYDPSHVSAAKDETDLWNLRRLLERSTALKIPTIGGQLAGTKEIQKRFSSREIVEKFLPLTYFDNCVEIHKKAVDFVLECTAKQVDPLEDIDLFNRVVKSEKHNWVLKPQREGGGNNYFSDNMVDKLFELKKNNHNLDRGSAYVLMELLVPPPHKTTVLDVKVDSIGLRSFDADSELGIYSAFTVCRDKSTKVDRTSGSSLCGLGPLSLLNIPGYITLNTGGTLLRTKPYDQDEVGIYKGYGWLDSTLLVEDEEWIDLIDEERE